MSLRNQAPRCQQSGQEQEEPTQIGRSRVTPGGSQWFSSARYTSKRKRDPRRGSHLTSAL